MAIDYKNFSPDGSFTLATMYPQGIFVSSDGTKCFVMSWAECFQHDLSTPYDITTASANGSLDTSANVSSAGAIHMSPDMSQLYIVNTSTNNIEQFTLSTPGTISSGSYTRTYTTGNTYIKSVILSPDGLTMIIASRQYIYQYTLSSAWDISTASLTNTFDTQTINFWNIIDECYVESDGKGIHIWYGSEEVFFYLEFGTAWDASTIAAPDYPAYNSMMTWDYESVTMCVVPGDVDYFYLASNGSTKAVYQFTEDVGDTSFSGTIQEEGVAVARTVRAYNRETGELTSETTSSGVDGSFTLTGLVDTVEYYLIALDDDSGDQYNLIGYDRIVGV